MKLTKEQVMLTKQMNERGPLVHQLAKPLKATEGAMHHRLKHQGKQKVD